MGRRCWEEVGWEHSEGPWLPHKESLGSWGSAETLNPGKSTARFLSSHWRHPALMESCCSQQTVPTGPNFSYSERSRQLYTEHCGLPVRLTLIKCSGNFQLMQLLFRVNFHFRPYVHKIQENSFSRLYLGRFVHFISSDSTSFKPLRSLSVPGLQMIYLFSERVNVTPKCVPENIWIIMEESFLFRTGKVSIYLTSSSNTILYKL